MRARDGTSSKSRRRRARPLTHCSVAQLEIMRISPATRTRSASSACAVMVSSQDANRQWIYAQQQTVSAEGFAGTSFSPYFPHTVRSRETKQCSDCHLSDRQDNNAIMAQTLLHGTNAVNFIGRF